MFSKFFAILNLVYQIADFAVKGAIAYSETEQGSKEWADVQAALVDVGALTFEAPTNAESEAAPPSSGTPLQDWTPAQVEAWFEEQAANNADAERQVTRFPKQHAAHTEAPPNV